MKMRMAAAVVVGALALAGVATGQKETRGVSKTEIVLGMHTDLSGPAATYGVSSSNAVKMRFDEANATGGIHGRKIRLVVEDTQYQVPRAVQAGTKLINRDRIFAMVAGLGTPNGSAPLSSAGGATPMGSDESILIKPICRSAVSSLAVCTRP